MHQNIWEQGALSWIVDHKSKLKDQAKKKVGDVVVPTYIYIYVERNGEYKCIVYLPSTNDIPMTMDDNDLYARENHQLLLIQSYAQLKGTNQ